ncbi:hypothetical protein JW978_00020 [Candidatus Dojkabacteria bacterium]|nr:hypothetical protein [Candidatus Dojkabacteria bacterium]
MRKNLILLFIIASTSLLFSQKAHADLIVPGTKSVDWCYEISNIDDYPNYVFVYNEERVSDFGVINQGDCFIFYKIGLAGIYAIPKADFDESELDEDFFAENNPKLIRSNIQLDPYGSVQWDDPLDKVVITLEILSLDPTSLDIQKSNVTYSYLDGTSEEKPFQSQDAIPEPSRSNFLPGWFMDSWFIILPVTAIIGIGAVLLIRKYKK